MRAAISTFIFAATAVTAVAAQQPTMPPPVSAPATKPPTPSAPIQSVVPITPGQTPPPVTPPRTVPVTPAPGPQGPALPPPSRRPETTPPALDTRNSGRTWQNIAVEITITDSVNANTTTSITKTANMLVLDGESGQVRSAGAGTINVDVLPSIRPDGRIFLRMTLEYLPDLSSQQTQPQNASRTSFNQSMSLILVPNKKVLVSQTSDPKSDREVTVHVTATVEK